MPAIKDILYVRFTVTDLAKQRQFLQDFGLHTEIQDGLLIARGSDSKPFIYLAQEAVSAEFVSVGFEADSVEDLYAIAAIDEVEVVDNPLPGGGLITRLTDPNGFCIEIVAGQQPPASLTVGTRSGFNNGQEKHRIGARVAFEPGDCLIKRLGHTVLFVHDFATTFAWYSERLGLIISDEIVMENDGKEQSLGAFTRCNRGDEYVDHHTMFFIHAGKAEFNHAAFEVADWDVLMKNHYELKQAGYRHSFGVGKHILGSQVFDYWKDPDGFTLEHFTDGDLFNAAFGSHKRGVEDLVGTFWGPEGMPGQ